MKFIIKLITTIAILAAYLLGFLLYSKLVGILGLPANFGIYAISLLGVLTFKNLSEGDDK